MVQSTIYAQSTPTDSDMGNILDRVRADPEHKRSSQFNCFSGPAASGNPFGQYLRPGIVLAVEGGDTVSGPGLCSVSRELNHSPR